MSIFEVLLFCLSLHLCAFRVLRVADLKIGWPWMIDSQSTNLHEIFSFMEMEINIFLVWREQINYRITNHGIEHESAIILSWRLGILESIFSIWGSRRQRIISLLACPGGFAKYPYPASNCNQGRTLHHSCANMKNRNLSKQNPKITTPKKICIHSFHHLAF